MLVLGLAVAGMNYSMIAEAAQENVFSMSVENFEDILVVDDENCCFKITGVEEGNLWGYTWKVYAENKTDKTLMFSFDDVAVNGYMCDPFWGAEIPAGKRSNAKISWFSDTFEENGIIQVDGIGGVISVHDEENVQRICE